MGNENKDVIKVHDAEGDLSTTLKPGMNSFASDSFRMGHKNLGDSSMRFYSDDSKQVLIAGIQNVTGGKFFSILGLTRTTQVIDTDGGVGTEVLLNSDVSSFIQVQNDVTGNPATSYTVGMKAGVTDGQICVIHLEDDYAIQLDHSVLNSASIDFYSGSTLSLGDVANQNSVMMIWNASLDLWEELRFFN